ncbi:hypothetical protein V8E55_003495 [Tylopilus felleus]
MPVPTRVHSPWVTHTHRNPPAADLQVTHHRLPGYPPTHHRPYLHPFRPTSISYGLPVGLHAANSPDVWRIPFGFQLVPPG